MILLITIKKIFCLIRGLMDFFEVINKRYSYRGRFADKSVPKSDIIKILDAGLKAPSGKNLQTTSFIAVTKKKLLSDIKDLFSSASYIESCNCFIFCLTDREPEPVLNGYHFQLEDCAAAVENMLLAISALGYSSVWIDGVLRKEKRAESLAEILNIPSNKKIQIMLPVGIAIEEYPRKEKKKFEDRVKILGDD